MQLLMFRGRKKMVGFIYCLTLMSRNRREIIARGQSYGWRLPKYWLPTPLSARRVCTPRLLVRGRTHSLGGEGGGGSIFWKTSDTALYSTYVSALWSQWIFRSQVPVLKSDQRLIRGRNWGSSLSRHYLEEDKRLIRGWLEAYYICWKNGLVRSLHSAVDRRHRRLIMGLNRG